MILDEIRAGDEQAAQVYADLVEQRGDAARAMLIRRQWQLARLPAWSRAATEARWEVDFLVTRHGDAWRAELPQFPGVTWLGFERGFVGSVRVAGASVLHEHAEALGAASPTLSRVVIRDLDEREAPLVREIPWLRTLCLESDDGVHPHARQSLLNSCRELEVVLCTLEDSAAFLEASRTMQLERLTVQGEHTGGITLARHIHANPKLHGLRVLELGTRFIDFNYGYYGRPTLREAGAELLTVALEHVEVLDVTRQHVGTPGLQHVLAAAPKLRELVAGVCDLTDLEALHGYGAAIDRLELRFNAIGIGGMTSLLTAPRLVACKQLVLDTCELDAGSIELLVSSPCWESLQVLDLSRNALGDAAMTALATAQSPVALHTLKLADIEVSSEALTALASAPWLGQLVEVDLAKLPVPRALLAELRGVRSLGLAACKLETIPVELFEHAVHLDLTGTDPLPPTAAPMLQKLGLARCGLDARSLSRVLDGTFPRLVELDVSHNVIDVELIKKLVDSELVRGLSRLVLQGYKLDTAAIELLAAQGLGSLELLDLRDVHSYTADEMLVFARSEPLRAIKRLAFHGTPWQYPRPVQDELNERFGAGWTDHADDPIDDKEDS
jgi:hypothetical protein